MTSKARTLLAQRLREARERAGMSAMAAATAVGSIPGSIYKWETGQRVPSEETKWLLAKAYKCSVADFYK